MIGKSTMAKLNQDDMETTADEQDYNEASSNCSSDVELDYDKTRKVLKAKINDKTIDIRISGDCKSKNEALNSLFLKYLSDIDMRRARSNDYYNKVKDNEEFKSRLKEYKGKWFQANKERLRNEATEKYKNDPDFRQRLNDKNKRSYARRTEGVEKQKRGRKPKETQTETTTERRPRGRPKTK